jgi:hypothetical protein
MYSLVYVSSAVLPFSPGELRMLLDQCRVANAQRGVTGMLLYQDGNIMQVLEGEQQSVLGLYAKIQRDPRHSGAMILLKSYIDERAFAEWSMAFRDLNDPQTQSLPGFSTFLVAGSAPALSANPTQAQRLLQYFQQNMR